MLTAILILNVILVLDLTGAYAAIRRLEGKVDKMSEDFCAIPRAVRKRQVEPTMTFFRKEN